ncbi:hypothetical protein D3C72_1588130 [compost metagenome]
MAPLMVLALTPQLMGSSLRMPPIRVMDPRSLRCGMAARVSLIWPISLFSSPVCHCSSVISGKALKATLPLATSRASNRPIPANRAVMEAQSVMSTLASPWLWPTRRTSWSLASSSLTADPMVPEAPTITIFILVTPDWDIQDSSRTKEKKKRLI